MKKIINLTFCALALTPIVSSCAQKETSLMQKYTDWSKTTQQDFWNHLNDTYEYYDIYSLDAEAHEQTSTALWNIHTPAQAILSWTYGAGGAFDYWGTALHNGANPDEMKSSSEKKYISGGLPDPTDPFNLEKNITRYAWTNLKDFVWLDDALSYGYTGTMDGKNVIAYHGYEYNEYEMINTINNLLGVADILDMNPSDARSIKVNDLLAGKEIVDNCWCATTLSDHFAWDWANGSPKKNVPVYIMKLDPSVKSAYVSSINKTWFDGIYMAWPHEYQLLTERNLKFKITKAEWQQRPNNEGNFLNIYCDVTRNLDNVAKMCDRR